MTILESVELFYGQVTQHVAHVYLRISADAMDEPWQLEGTVRGPYSPRSATLPATAKFIELPDEHNDAEARLWRAVVLDPCTWTPELPHSYEVSLQVRNTNANNMVTQQQRTLAFRTVGCRNGSLRLEGRRWVPRGIHYTADDAEIDLPVWREAAAVLVRENPSDELMQAASDCGVWIFPEIDARSDTFVESVRQVASFPCAPLILVRNAPSTIDPTTIDRNIVFVPVVTEVMSTISDWASIVCFETSNVDALISHAAQGTRPVIGRVPCNVPRLKSSIDAWRAIYYSARLLRKLTWLVTSFDERFVIVPFVSCCERVRGWLRPITYGHASSRMFRAAITLPCSSALALTLFQYE